METVTLYNQLAWDSSFLQPASTSRLSLATRRRQAVRYAAWDKIVVGPRTGIHRQNITQWMDPTTVWVSQTFLYLSVTSSVKKKQGLWPAQ